MAALATRRHGPRRLLVTGAFVGRDVVHHRFALEGHVRVEVDELPDSLGDVVGHAGDHHAAVAVADEDDVGEVLVVQHRGDVRDVRVEVGLGGGEVRRAPRGR